MARPDADPEGAKPEEEPISAAPESLRAPKTLPPESAGPLTPRSRASDPTELDLAPPGSTSRPAPAKPGDPDTLISAPRPAERDELDDKDRFRLVEDRIDELEARVRMLERPRPEGGFQRTQPWWIWLIFLVGLALTWRLLQALR